MKTILNTTTLLLTATPLWAQCSLCKLAVEQDASLGSAFNKAIVLMMVPALAVFAGVFLLALRSAPGSRSRNDSGKNEQVR
jgi:heme/copper-type cytochrome/quinol oxidase subunit 2